jgi:hypothetical protein
MNIRLYAKAFLSANRQFTSRVVLERYVRKYPAFQYEGATYKNFARYYKSCHGSTGWFHRKLIAIPAAAFTLTIKTTYHLALAFFIGIPIAFIGPEQFFFRKIYAYVRDLQEASGRILTLFYDKVGLYHIQESQFHKQLYMRNCL